MKLQLSRRGFLGLVTAAAQTSVYLLTGCMVGPKYIRPAVQTPPAYTAPVAEGGQDIGQVAWWHIFQDDELDHLESVAAIANEDIAIAVARYDKAAATTRTMRAGRLPQVGAVVGAERNREPKFRPNNATTGRAITYNDFATELTASYELDAWGRVRRSIQKSSALRQAASAEVSFVRLTVQAEIAADLCDVREADEELTILDEQIANASHAARLVGTRLHRGLSTAQDLQRTVALADQLQADRQVVSLRRTQFVTAIAILTGQPPERFTIAVRTRPLISPLIPAGVPAQLLLRRPDIAEAERQMSSASAGIGLAKANFLPTLTLTGLAGYQSTNAASLVDWQSTVESLAISAVAPIFTGGRRHAAEDQARAAYRESLEQYKKTVLQAYGGVEDQLAALESLKQQLRYQREVAEADRDVLRLAQQSYTAGLVSYLDVTTAQAALELSEQNICVLSGHAMVASVALIKELGGGWEEIPLP
ncbi:efflux transporter outer membrane subunit [Terriglobus roseus]|uniref:Efflux transporter, outer membrane factor (OMF) lipoprotein, NodT family n=1 Tax=Terriglobus roseus TaxID=392734 RepID=A0A1H4J0G6_9BACT|nr:efflux transporter outer membrane subunit [Terriglobus roseus]SEB39799.1 efflux transporter, outer membrane factor (OMF) lipoprotein, NodT family [Terriglobus roseus]